jgi:hypothetical protein
MRDPDLAAVALRARARLAPPVDERRLAAAAAVRASAFQYLTLRAITARNLAGAAADLAFTHDLSPHSGSDARC